MQAMRKVWRTKGILAIAIEEAWWLSRAMSIRWVKNYAGIDQKQHVENYRKLMEDFEEWARNKDTPARLARKPSKLKPKLDEVEETELTTDETLDLDHSESLRQLRDFLGQSQKRQHDLDVELDDVELEPGFMQE
jgi:hypothetical protein